MPIYEPGNLDDVTYPQVIGTPNGGFVVVFQEDTGDGILRSDIQIVKISEDEIDLRPEEIVQ